MQPLTALHLGSLVRGILSSKNRSSQMSDSRQTPISSVHSKSDSRQTSTSSGQNKFLCSGEDALSVALLLPSPHQRKVISLCKVSLVPNNFLGLDNWVFVTVVWVIGTPKYLLLPCNLFFCIWNEEDASCCIFVSCRYRCSSHSSICLLLWLTQTLTHTVKS